MECGMFNVKIHVQKTVKGVFATKQQENVPQAALTENGIPTVMKNVLLTVPEELVTKYLENV